MDELQTSELLRQTGRIRWSELQRTFAQGRLLLVADGLDLIAIAKAIIDDATEKVEPLLAGQQIGHISAAQAKQWYADEQEFWSVVVAPWVLIQISQSES